MSITNYWVLPAESQEDIRKSNPETRCKICRKPSIRLLSCDACGEDMCFACTIPCGVIWSSNGDPNNGDILLCKECGTF